MNDVIIYTIPEGDWEALYVNGKLIDQGKHLFIDSLKKYTPIQSIQRIHIENFDSDRDVFPKTTYEFPDNWRIRVK